MRRAIARPYAAGRTESDHAASSRTPGAQAWCGGSVARAGARPLLGAQRQRQLGALVDGYEQFREFDRRELALIEPLRTLRLIHYSAWLARRWDDPAFPRAFPWFGSSDYWKGQCQMLEDQLEAMAEEPLVV